LQPFYKHSITWRSFLQYWSGRILIINAVVFIAISWTSHSIFTPDYSVLLAYGAKDPVGLAQGEYWRFVSPIFVHIGIIHFLFNSYALYYIGFHIERMIGSRWFLFIYLLSGISGNISSSLFSMATSAGASGAIFGIIGCGFFVERTMKKHLSQVVGSPANRGIYRSLIVINLIFGFIVPGIDNANHIGGLICGVFLTRALLYIKQNQLIKAQPKRGYALILLWFLLMSVSMSVSTSKSFLTSRFQYLLANSVSFQERYYLLTRLLQLDPYDPNLSFARGKLLLILGEDKEAFYDLRRALAVPGMEKKFQKLVEEMLRKGDKQSAWKLQQMIKHQKSNPPVTLGI